MIAPRLRCSPAMTVGAPHFAFFHLPLQYAYRRTTANERSYLAQLVSANVVEFKHDGVSLAAVHAWMLQQERQNDVSITVFVLGFVDDLSGIVRGFIPSVERPKISAHAMDAN